MKSNRKIFAVGLTGGIGSGKTEAGKIFESFGVKLIRADIIAKEMVDSHSEIKRKILGVFGKDIYLSNGKLDRSKMAGHVFNDSNLLKKLNQIVHPIVIKFIDSEIHRYHRSGKYPFVVVEAALIFEADIAASFDYIIVVDADDEIRKRRLMGRDKTSREEILNRFKAQLPQRTKILKADFAIKNNGDLKSLRERCFLIYRLLNRMSGLISTEQKE
jgi:dephospho-CoA kinase